MSNGVGCSSCGAIVAAAECERCGAPPIPGVRGWRQAAAFVLGGCGTLALALGMVVAFSRGVPGANEAVGGAVRWVIQAVGLAKGG